MISSDERALLTDAVRGALAGADDAGAALSALGWPEMLASEPDAAIAIVCTELGRANATATVLDDVLLHALGEELGAPRAVLLPPFGASTIEVDAGAVFGLASQRAVDGAELVAVYDDRVHAVATEAVEVRAVRGIDPAARLFAVRIDLARARIVSEHAIVPGTWDGAVALARRALAHDVAGASRRMLEFAREHALERVQFGRPVARFQAVRHRLADALVAVEGLEAVLAVAAAEPDAMTAALAKAVAGRSARAVAGHAQQVLAGIGFTTDHPFHRYLQRTMLLDGLFGSADTVTRELGRTLLAARRVPTLVEL